MKKLHSKCLAVIMIFSILPGCDTEDTEEEIDDLLNGGPGSVTATINGEEFVAEGRLVEARLNIDDDPLEFSLRIDAERDKDGFEEDIDLNLFGVDFDLLEVGDVFTGDAGFGELNFSGNYGKISRMQGDDTDIQTETEPDVASNVCTITKLDRENRLVSGTFSFDAIDFFDGTGTYEVRDGVFTDLSY